MGLCLSNCQHTKEGFTFFHTCTHTKHKQNEQLILKTSKKILRKLKEGEKKPARKTEIDNIFKNYKKQE